MGKQQQKAILSKTSYNPMKRHCQFTVKRPPKCAVRGDAIGYSYGIGDNLPSLTTHTFPVTPSTSTDGEPILYRSGLVRLYRRIAAKINSAPSLNCVLVIATQ